MNYADFLARVISDGIAAVKTDYAKDERKLNGAILGFTECLGKIPGEIAELLHEANQRCVDAHRDQAEDYWYWRCRAAEIEWVANVVSAAQMNSGLPVIITPTVRGTMKAAEILGVRENA